MSRDSVEERARGAGTADVTGGKRTGAIVLVRSIHGAITAFFLSCMGVLFYAGITGELEFAGWVAAALLVGEGVVVGLNGGDCPLGGIHRSVGDDRTFFELLMPAALAKRAVPLLGGLAAFGIVLLALRSA